MTARPQLIDENGNILERVPHAPGLWDQLDERFLASHDRSSLRFIPYINPYGDTVFNVLQMEDFLEEWKLLYGLAESDAERDFVRGVEELAVKVRDADHLYLRFWGD